MPVKKSKSAGRRTRLNNLPKKEKELSKRDQKKVKGGLLPYIEQDNLYKGKTITDGTSNTIITK